MVDEKKNWLWSPSGFWDKVKEFFKEMFQAVWGDLDEKIPDYINAAWDSTLKMFGSVETDQWTKMLDMWVRAGMMTQNEAAEIIKLKDAGTPLDILWYFMVTFKLTGAYFDTTLYATTASMRHALFSKYGPEIPPPQAIINAAFVAPERTGEVRDAMRRSGFTEEMIDLQFLANYRLYSEDTIRTLWLRGILDDEEMFVRMRELGYTDTRIKEIIQGWEILPGPQDLFFMVAKEAFEPETYNRLGLNLEFPEEQVEWLEKQGISRRWAEKYWIAHWDQPSIGQGYEMLHRGVIDLEELEILYKTVEIPKYWRDKLTAIAYSPYTRVDVRRMHALGVIDDEALLRAYMDLGYNEDKARNMTRFTIAYNQEPEKELTKGEILSGYREGAIEKADAVSMLMDLSYPEDTALYYISYEDYKRDKAFKDDLIKNIETRYKGNLIDEAAAGIALAALNLPARQIALLLDQWRVWRLNDQKVPSKTDLAKFYKLGIITIAQFRDELKRLGYNDTYTAWYIAQADKEKTG